MNSITATTSDSTVSLVYTPVKMTPKRREHILQQVVNQFLLDNQGVKLENNEVWSSIAEILNNKLRSEGDTEIVNNSRVWKQRWTKLQLIQKRKNIWSSEVISRMKTLVDEQKSTNINWVRIVTILNNEFKMSVSWYDCQQQFKKIIPTKEDEKQAKAIKNIEDEKAKEHCQSDEDKISPSTRIKWTKEESKLLKQLVDPDSRKNDWKEIAEKIALLPTHIERSTHSCSCHWAQSIKPTINVEPWKLEDDEKLYNLVSLYNDDWIKIAEKINDRRTNHQCYHRWMSIIALEWASDDEELLFDLVEMHGQNNWTEIAGRINKGQTAMQCRFHWENHVREKYKTGEWLPEEDEKLWSLAKQLRCSLKTISKEIGRSRVQCEKRISHLEIHFDPLKWTDEEDKKLLDLIIPGKRTFWQKVAKQIEGRTARECKNRWDKHLKKISLAKSLSEFDESTKEVPVRSDISSADSKQNQQIDPISLLDGLMDEGLISSSDESIEKNLVQPNSLFIGVKRKMEDSIDSTDGDHFLSNKKHRPSSE